MADDIVEDVPTPEEIVSEPGALPEDVVEHTPPPWAAELIAKVESLTDAVAELAPNPVAPPLPVVEDEPDESPVKLPWTHRGF